MKQTDITVKNEGEKQISGNDTGRSYTKALALLKNADPHQQTAIDDYIITIGFEKAAGWYVMNDQQQLEWKPPEAEQNVHCEVIVQDINDLRFIPYLTIYYRLFDNKGNEIEKEKKIDFIWHPFIYHYAENWIVPHKADYYAQVLIKTPTFRRHDEVRGDKYTDDILAKFGPVHVIPGRRPYGPE